VLTYNGAVAGTYSTTGSITGTDLQDANANFSNLGVIAGDVVVINPFDGNREEVTIDSVTDNQNLVLK
jgi:hypothetical protein